MRKGEGGEVALRGYHVPRKGEGRRQAVAPIPRTRSRSGRSTLSTRCASRSATSRRSIRRAARFRCRSTINGRIAAPGAENRYRFQARKGEQLVLEVNARRLGSDLDSYSKCSTRRASRSSAPSSGRSGRPSITLRDHDSAGRGIRIAAWGPAAGDYVMIGSEILRVEALPLSPDADIVFESFGGQRLAYFDTTPEAHAIDSPVYKVQIHPPGTKLSPNGLPVAHLYYRNDDGGPGYGADSLLHFTAPADGEYIVRMRDVAGAGRRQLRLPADRAPAASGFPADRQPAQSERAGGRRGAGDGDGVSAWTGSTARSMSRSQDLPRGLARDARRDPARTGRPRR